MSVKYQLVTTRFAMSISKLLANSGFGLSVDSFCEFASVLAFYFLALSPTPNHNYYETAILVRKPPDTDYRKQKLLAR